jgi:hypothetical protein
VATSVAEAWSKEAEFLVAEVEWALADPALAVGPLTTIAEVCIIRTRAPDRRVFRFVNRLLLPGRIMP